MFVSDEWNSNRLSIYGSSTPNLQQLAMKILGLTFSSGCERNWSVFEKVINLLFKSLCIKKLHNLVYVKYNQALKQRYNLKDEVDPISLHDIDECNEWLVEEMDGDDDDEEAQDERVFDGDDPLTWGYVYRASGVGEPIMYTRCRRKQPPCGEGASSQNVSKRGKRGPSTRKGKMVQVVEEDSEDITEELEEELPNINFEIQKKLKAMPLWLSMRKMITMRKRRIVRMRRMMKIILAKCVLHSCCLSTPFVVF
uniref:HAT C-terminal dimerisation domain-containing protein n=1 Tax=Cajanus cajan TaxID=3821 RepID=A0A151UBF4_CAJCA|nr:hypothetical protein KK1_020893 [Cajanus cajan]